MITGDTDNKDYIEKMNIWGEQKKPYIFIIDFEINQPLVLPLNEAAENGLYYSFDNLNNIDFPDVQKRKFSFKKYPVSFPVYKESFDKVMTQIKLGNSFLTNLTFPTDIATDLTLPELFSRSEAPFKLLFKDSFVVFSPELFVMICEGKISSYPMKGTIDASIPDAENIILNDPKETAEHHTIVDMIRSDLSLVATNVKVEKFRFLNAIKTQDKTLLQVSSEVTGELPVDYRNHLGDILSKLLPAGSICGAPKKKTLEIISNSEIYKRGYYTGVFGIFDGTDLKSAVMIRFIEKLNDKLIFKSGGGITFSSDPEKEYLELTDKVYVPIH